MPSYGSFVSVGSRIYLFGTVPGVATSTALAIECRSHTMQTLPSLPKPMFNTVADVVDKKIYVIGECKSGDSKSGHSKRIVVFDTETQTWEAEMTKPEMELGNTGTCVVMDGKMYMRYTCNTFVYWPNERSWETDEILDSKRWMYACAVDDVLYYLDRDEIKIRTYDPKVRCWGVLKGVEDLLPKTSYICWWHTVSYGEKLVVFLSEEGVHEGTAKDILCAEIALERRQGGEIWGKVEWCDVVFDGSLILIKALAVMV